MLHWWSFSLVAVLLRYILNTYIHIQFSSVQLLSRVRFFATPWIAARQASLSITNTQSSLRLTSIELVMPSSHLILCHPLLLLHSFFPSSRVFSNESVLCINWPKYWSFSFSISSSSEYPGLISFRPGMGTPNLKNLTHSKVKLIIADMEPHLVRSILKFQFMV